MGCRSEREEVEVEREAQIFSQLEALVGVDGISPSTIVYGYCIVKESAFDVVVVYIATKVEAVPFGGIELQSRFHTPYDGFACVGIDPVEDGVVVDTVDTVHHMVDLLVVDGGE